MDNKRQFFTAEKKMHLKELVNKHKDILECKKTDCVSVPTKKTTWVKLTKEFNGMLENSCRSTEQLRKCWENMKSRRKKELSEEKRLRLKTGGGSMTSTKITTDDDIDDILNAVDIEIKDKDTIDSDTVIVGEDDNDIDKITDTGNGIDITLEAAETASKKPQLLNEEVGEPSQKNRESRQKKGKPSTYVGRSTAIEQELHVRLRRNELLEAQEKEIHALRLEEHQLRVQEQKFKISIAEQQLKQELLKTAQLENSLLLETNL